MINTKQVYSSVAEPSFKQRCVAGLRRCRLCGENAFWRSWTLYQRFALGTEQVVAVRPQHAVAANQLNCVADSLSGIAQTVQAVYHTIPPQQEDFNWVVETMQHSLCDHCAQRAKCWSSHYQALMDGLFALKPILEQTEHAQVEQFSAGLSYCAFPAAMASEMTRAYALYRGKTEARLQSEALRSALTEQYSAVATALEALSGQLSEGGQAEFYKTRCAIELFSRLGMPPSECAVTQNDSGQYSAVITLARTQFSAAELAALAQELSRTCHCAFAVPQKLSCKGVTTLLFQERHALRPSFGVAMRAAKGGVSGDAVQQFCHGNEAQMILCDGMGTGRPAAVDGNLAAELTARLLKVGVSAQSAARLVNIALSLKSEEESSATLDLCSVNLYTGQTHLFKAGAVASFVVQGTCAKAVGEQSLPVGILGEVMASECQLQLNAGDLLVLVSDGMLVQGESWILKQLTRAAAVGQSAQGIAELLVRSARAHARDGVAYPDDITAAVMQLLPVQGRN